MARFFLFLLTVFNSLCICANVTADDKLAMNIGGNLNVESKQDTDYAKGNNWGVNAGVGHGYGTNAKGQDMSGNRSGNAGFNVGSSNHDSAWVNDVTELRGGDVDINVGGKTTVTGAVIAADEDGDLNLATNELEYKDLHDFNTSNERGFGVSTSVGGAVTDQGEFNLHPQGSTTVSATHTGSDTEQTTHATIGAGNITVGGDTNPELAGLNRDTDKVQEITKDQITGALDASVTVDNRLMLGWLKQPVYEKDLNGNTKLDENGNPVLAYERDENSDIKLDKNGKPIPLTTSGWGQIIDQHKNVIDNVKTSINGATRTVVGGIYAGYKTIEGVLTTKETAEKTKNAYEMSKIDTEISQERLKDFIAHYVKPGMTNEQKLSRIEELGKLQQTAEVRNERDALYASMTSEKGFIDQRTQHAIQIAQHHTTDPQFWFMDYGWNTFTPEQQIKMANLLGQKQASAVGNQDYTPVSYPDPYYISMSDNNLGLNNYLENKTHLNPNIMDDFMTVVGVVSHENSGHGFQTTVIIPNGIDNTSKKAMELNRSVNTRPNTGRDEWDELYYDIYRTSPDERDAFQIGDAVEGGLKK